LSALKEDAMNQSDLHAQCRRAFGDYVYLSVMCNDQFSTFELLAKLPFVTRTAGEMRTPEHVRIQAFVDPSGVTEIVIAGILSQDEVVSVIRGAKSLSLRVNSGATGGVPSQILRGAMYSLGAVTNVTSGKVKSVEGDIQPMAFVLTVLIMCVIVGTTVYVAWYYL
jgi:hypothetical protein